jgi:hypothetical protein
LWVDGGNTHVWTYQAVSEWKRADGTTSGVNQHHSGPIKRGESYRLTDGTVITLDNPGLSIGGMVVPNDTLNVFIQEDGQVRLGAFIRTFD